MAKTDCRRDALHNQPSEMDGVEAALLGLTQKVAANSARLESLEHKLDAIMECFGLPRNQS